MMPCCRLGKFPEMPRLCYARCPNMCDSDTSNPHHTILICSHRNSSTMLENIYLCRHGFRSNWEDETIE